jgi:uncharacterized protein YjbJ (UPF0337 family)
MKSLNGAVDARLPTYRGESAMQSENLKRQATGTGQTILGRIERVLGRLFGSREWEAKGAAEELRGRTNMAAGRAAEKVQGGVEKAAETVEQKAGEVMGSQKGVEGRAKEIEDKARQVLNR